MVTTAVVWGGAQGVGKELVETKYIYSLNGEEHPSLTDEDWSSSVPAVRKGEYLWIWERTVFTDQSVSDRFSINYIPLDVDNNSYVIETNQEEVLCFYLGRDDVDTLAVSPQSLTFQVYQAPKTADSKTINFFDNFEFSYFDQKQGAFVSLIREELRQCYQYGTDSNVGVSDPNILYYNFETLFNFLKKATSLTGELAALQKAFIRKKEEDPINISLKFAYLENGKERGIKIITLREGLSSEEMSFSTIANKMTMAIQNTAIDFGAQGIDIYGAGLTIFKSINRFELTQDSTPSADKTYYFKHGSQYEKWEGGDSFADGVDYYEIKPGVRSLYADKDGNLHLSGTIDAAEGYFKGTIEADYATLRKGTIGGFDIADGLLTSWGTYAAGKPSIVLDGQKGVITAQNLNLGAGVTVTDHLQFIKYEPVASPQAGGDYYILKGDEDEDDEDNKYYEKFTGQDFDPNVIYYEQKASAYIYNPDKNDGAFIKAGEIEFKADGSGSIGDIKIDSQNSEISCDSSWSISPERAVFNNAIINGTLETTTFKAGSTQAVGSSMIFAPSYRIASFDPDKGEVKFAEDEQVPLENFSSGMQFWLVTGNVYHRYSYKEAGEDWLKLQWIADKNGGQAPRKDYVALVVLGKPKLAVPSVGLAAQDKAYEEIAKSEWLIQPTAQRGAETPLIIGMNGSGAATASGLIKGRGLTVTGLDTQGSPALFLGDLSALNITGESGYGLHADNVYLQGSLTTKLDSGKYAGVNTNHSTKATQIVGDESKIVFWAGATLEEADTTPKIEEAPFQVTENGSLYATRAQLTDSLLVGGVIQGSDIYTARLHGGGKDAPSALTIYDTNKGISFKSGYGTKQEIETLAIGAKGFLHNGESFIHLNDASGRFLGKVGFVGDILSTKTNSQGGYLQMSQEGDTPVIYHYESKEQNCGFYFGSGATSYKITSGGQQATKLSLQGAEVRMYGSVKFMEQEESDLHFEYRPVTGGYDLYIQAIAEVSD